MFLVKRLNSLRLLNPSPKINHGETRIERIDGFYKVTITKISTKSMWDPGESGHCLELEWLCCKGREGRQCPQPGIKDDREMKWELKKGFQILLSHTDCRQNSPVPAPLKPATGALRYIKGGNIINWRKEKWYYENQLSIWRKINVTYLTLHSKIDAG